MKNIFLTSTICFILALAANGQTLQDRIKAVPDAKKFEQSYDKFKDKTQLQTYIRFRLPRAKISALQCTVAAVFPGQEITKQIDDFFLLCGHVGFSGGSWQFLDSRRLIFLIDGKDKINLGDGKHEGKAVLGGVKEWVIYGLTRSQLQSLADAKQIEMQMGNYETEVEKDGHPRLKTMLSLTEAPTKN